MSKAQEILEKFKILRTDSETKAVDILIAKIGKDNIEKLLSDVVQAGNWQDVGMADESEIQKVIKQVSPDFPEGDRKLLVTLIKGQKARDPKLKV